MTDHVGISGMVSIVGHHVIHEFLVINRHCNPFT